MAETHDYEAVFREVYPRLVALGVLKTGRLDTARDLAQETMLRAHTHWDDVATYDAPGAWCARVMTNLLIDHHRSAASEQRAVDRLRTRAVASDGRRHEEPSATPALDRWNELTATLSERQRLVAAMYYADDLSVAEIAERIGTSRGAVKATLFKIRRALRARLDAANADEGEHRSEGDHHG
ncbi:MAG: RNA polymerase sigma factor [Ilumatobacter sp.]|uniref:RNA polymerase sigma factor n=1 Tax=Ilumatobacter sp. TaxID=1967498 RepID=UPI00391D55AA